MKDKRIIESNAFNYIFLVVVVTAVYFLTLWTGWRAIFFTIPSLLIGFWLSIIHKKEIIYRD